jgi:DNA repair protein RadC
MQLPEIEISVRFIGQPNAEPVILKGARSTADILRTLFDPGRIEWTEEFIMLSLNSAAQVIGYYRVSRGGMSSTLIDVRVIAQVALQSMATSVIVAHNHPSGSIKPSEADKNATRKIRDGLRTLDITLLDHFIITN